MIARRLAVAFVVLAGCGEEAGRDPDEIGDSDASSGDSGDSDSSDSSDSDSTDSESAESDSSDSSDSDSTDSSSTTDSDSTDTAEDESTTGDPEDCSTNPIPWCTADTQPTPNGVPDEPAGIDGCPPGMTRVDTFCIDRWEAALVEILPNDALAPWSPYVYPGDATTRAVSAPGLVPQAYISQTRAASACQNAGKRMCTDVEWLRACQGSTTTTYPFGNTAMPGTCNDARTCHPAIQYFETNADWIWSELGHPCLDQLPEGLDETGANPGCVSEDGVFDMMGNLHEWTADPEGTFRGGYFVDTLINGPGCTYKTSAHTVSHWDYSTGFRCCAD
jgi:sulfatase modifying factor 1